MGNPHAGVIALLFATIALGGALPLSSTAAQITEAEVIASTKGIATREGLKLTLHSGNKTLTFVDEDQCAEGDVPHCKLYRLVAYYPDHHALIIQNGYYETSDYEWVSDRTLISQRIEDAPHYSPSGKMFAVVQSDESASWHGIQIWRLVKGVPILEWDYAPETYENYGFVTWTNDKLLELRLSIVVDHEMKSGLRARVLYASHGTHKWHLEGPHGSTP